jgi:hypothetical protein
MTGNAADLKFTQKALLVNATLHCPINADA